MSSGRGNRSAVQGTKAGVGQRAFRRQASRVAQKEQRRRVIRSPQKPAGPSLRERLSRVPRIAWICALVACINAVCWSIVSPPFQVPDEPEHVAYVKQLAESDRLPIGTDAFSGEEFAALEGTRLQEVAERPQNRTIATRAQNQELQHRLSVAAGEPRDGSPGAGVAASQPPLYYALEAIPYSLGGGTLLDRLALMRLFSALFGALTAMFVYLFVREALPGVPWASTTAGLAIAFTPMLGFMSGAVNPDSMLYSVSAMIFFALARAFRRGFTRRRAVLLGGLIAIGFMTKLNFAGLAVGALAGMVVLAVRERRELRRVAWISLLIGLGIALSPAILYVAIESAKGTEPFAIASVKSLHGSLLVRASYTWQMYLPRLPGMHNYFPGLFTTRQLWFNAYLGQLGWLDTPFPGWVETAALIPAALMASLCIRSLVICAGAVRSRISELLVYAAMAVGLLILIANAGYTQLQSIDTEYAQVRYIIPLVPLLGLVLALAARGAGRRWGPVVGALIVLLFLGHDIFSQLQVVARYYG